MIFSKKLYLKNSGSQNVYKFLLKFDLFGITEARNIH